MSFLQAQPRPSYTQADVLKKLDDEIAQLTAKLLSLKLTRNDFTLVSRLHPEILQEIFLQAHESSESKGETSLYITWVCHRWRAIALPLRALWSHIDFVKPKWVELSLSRAGNRALEFDFDYSSGRFPQIFSRWLLENCFSSFSRVRALKISGIAEESVASVENALGWTLPAPILADLYVDGLSLPRNLFYNSSSSLQSLFIGYSTIDWDTFPVIPHLRELILEEPLILCPLKKFLQILDVSKGSLVKLCLRAILENTLPVNGLDIGGEQIHLESLTCLEVLDDTPRVISSLFDHILVPPRSSIEICHFQWVQGSEREFSQALAKSRQMAHWPIKSLQISHDITSNPRLEFLEDSSDIQSVNSDNDDEDTSNRIILVFWSQFPVNLALLDLPIHPLKEVSLTSSKHHHGHIEVDILQHIGDLGSVEVLTIESFAIPSFLKFIHKIIAKLPYHNDENHFADTREGERHQPLLTFAHLEYLAILGNYQPYHLKQDDCESLQTWLKLKHLYGIQLKKLTLSSVTVPDISWIEGQFDGVVRELRMENVKEREPREQDV